MTIFRILRNCTDCTLAKLPQFNIALVIIKPFVHRFRKLAHRKQELALRLGERLWARRSEQRIESSLKRSDSWSDLHRELHERSKERRILALQIRGNDARMQRVRCDACRWSKLSAHIKMYMPFRLTLSTVAIVQFFGVADGGLFRVRVALSVEQHD
jgi:hypothetical protein